MQRAVFKRLINKSIISRKFSNVNMIEQAMDQASLKQYLADDPPTIVPLAIKPHFEALSKQERKYAHFISRAAFSGTRINFRQTSPESETIYDFILALHKECGGDWKKLESHAGLSSKDLSDFLNYAAQFLGNAGNFKSFGDSKFIPRLPSEKLAALAKTSPQAEKLWSTISHDVYESKKETQMHLGYPDKGHISTYYPNSPNITYEEIEYVSNFIKEQSLLPENTRLQKLPSGDFELLIASAVTKPSHPDIPDSSWSLEGPLKGKKLTLRYGDYHVEMGKIADNLEQAQKYALNKEEGSMQAEYVKSFRDGSMVSFLESQRHWIRDKGPMVESNIGFIETYRDPHGIRGEWEGFAAMVNKERTKAFGKLVESAPAQIPKLPWPKDFEKDKFLSPDFTSLEVLTFAGSGIPAGINIPNFDSIRQSEGFKNVSLGNVLSASAPKEPTPFVRPEDQELFDKYRDQAFEVQVGLHELLGHGCGKLLAETEPGKYNFDIDNPPTNPVTGKKVASWYKPGETWGTVFGGMGPSYEECRAESVAMSLCPDFDILKIFGYEGQEASDILEISYKSMGLAGLNAVRYYDVGAKKWGQAHMQARFAILQVFLEAGPEFCRLDYTKEDLSDLVIFLDATKIESVGRPAINKFLQKLQVYKATADLEAGKALYEYYTNVNDFYATKVRPEVLRQAKPRKVFVQANTFIEGDDVVLKEYEPTPEGMIASFADRDYI